MTAMRLEKEALMPRSLPEHPNFEALKKQAKSLLKSLNEQEPGVSRGLQQCQQILAQDYGFINWADLKRTVLGREKSATIRHIVCGDSCGATLRNSTVPGDIFVWHEIYITGPVPGNVTEQQFSFIREDHLANYFLHKSSPDDLKRQAKEKQARLDASRDYHEVVLWFDACLFDQTHLIHLLNHLSNALTPDTKLSLICIGEFTGFQRFLGLGQLNPEQMASLYDTRHLITRDEISLAQKAWEAFRSDDPRQIEAVIAGDCKPLPYLRDALIRFLEEYPSTFNGLSRLQNEILEAVATGALQLGPIFSKVSDAEPRPYFGDIMLWDEFSSLASATTPVLHVDGPQTFKSILKVDSEPVPKSELNKWRVSLTDYARKLLNGEADFVTTNGIDRWYGGVHLNGMEAKWRWNSQNMKLIERP